MQDINVLKSIKVLYVEDEPITRKQVCKFLSKRVGKVFEAENGKDGIKKFIEFRPDIIITDLVMPYMNGIEMMKKLREDGFDCPFIITSALSDSGTILETVDLKIDKYLIKPINVDILLDSLTQIAAKIIERKTDSIVLKDNLMLTEDMKNELEVEIRNIYSKYLKKVIGKGAKLIKVFINGREIEIFAKENFTTLEESLLSTGYHYKSIEVVRKTIYDNTIHEVENQISELINRKVSVKEIEISPKEKFERILIKII